MSKPKKGRVEKHNKWGYIFLIPFILTYVIFQLIPLISTIYNSFFENYSMGLIQVGPNYIGLENYASLFESGKLLIYLKNTMIMWGWDLYHRSYYHFCLVHGSQTHD